MSTVEASPFILYNPELIISGTSLRCLMSHIELNPDTTVLEVKTACGVTEYPGATKWTLKASLYHSFDPDGTNEVLTAAVAGRVPVPFSVIPDAGQPISDTNPEYTGELVPKPFPPINGDAQDLSAVELEWSIKGWTDLPTTNITPAEG